MFLFIFESIGTSELLLVGIVALIFLGPRKLPEMARKIGKIMAEFRSTTTEFKETWQREVNFDEEAKALNLDEIDAKPVPREIPAVMDILTEPEAPAIKEIDASAFENLPKPPEAKSEPSEPDLNDKANWL